MISGGNQDTQKELNLVSLQQFYCQTSGELFVLAYITIERFNVFRVEFPFSANT